MFLSVMYFINTVLWNTDFFIVHIRFKILIILIVKYTVLLSTKKSLFKYLFYIQSVYTKNNK